MTDHKRSRADYYRRRRRSGPKRLEEAARDAKRKRDNRGGYGNINRLYEDYIAALPNENQFAARLLFYYSPDEELPPPTTLKDDDKPLRELKPISLTANARRRRAEEYQAYSDRKIVSTYEQFSFGELESWVASRIPEPERERALAQMRDRYGAARKRLNARNENNAKKQLRYRQRNLEKVRAAEKQKTRDRRAHAKEARQLRPFVAIDAEGLDVGPAFPIEAENDQSLDLGLPERPGDDRRLIAQDHRTFLWGASGDDGRVAWLGGVEKAPLRAKVICDWLVGLPAQFPGAIFVMFSAGYDWTQIFRDIPYEKAWELWNGLPWSEHGNSVGTMPNRRRWVLWGHFGLRLYPGKYLEIAKFKNPDKIKDDKGKFDISGRIKIYDTFGFFQSSFINAATGFGGNLLKPEELEILTGGKSRRGQFADIPLHEIQSYTHVELQVLARMLSHLRTGLQGLGLALKDWHGAGCIAQAMMAKDRVTDFYPDISAEVNVDDLSDPLAWALRAYFGGRAEMIKQGVHTPKFFNLDISSAYPHILRQLPNMKNGTWRYHNTDQLLSPGASHQPISEFKRSHQNLRQILERLENMSLVSMVRLRFNFPPCHRHTWSVGHLIIVRADLPWFPLPIRADDGTIYFPRQGQGIYMVEEVRAMLRWAMRVYADAKADEQSMIALLDAFEFMPVNDAKPFRSRIEKGFEERAATILETEQAKREWERKGKVGPEPYDVREKILKLGLNSIYGKTAQSKGMRLVRDADGIMRAKPPKHSNMYFAAAVTAGTRAMLLDASSGDVDAIILFATDGICSTRELPNIEIPATKTLGAWEKSLRQKGVFVKSGIYSHEPNANIKSGQFETDKATGKPETPTTRMRGIRPASLPQGMTAAQWLIEKVPQAWKDDDLSLTFPYRAYKTFGAALVSRKCWDLAGHWIEGLREADIQRVSVKRDCRGLARAVKQDGGERRGERRREFALFDTSAAKNPLGFELSRPFNPDWIDEQLSRRVNAEDEQKMLECKNGFGFERD